MNRFNVLINTFNKYFGENIVRERLTSQCKKPTILIAGGQLTGKSTMAKRLSKHYQGGQFYSVGKMFRDLAESLNITVAEQSRLLLEIELAERANKPIEKSNPLYGKKVDIELDFKTCEIIQQVNSINNKGSMQLSQEEIDSVYSVIEGRQPAMLGSYLAQDYNRDNLIRIYVECSVREKAIRFLEREIGANASAIADKSLPHDTQLLNDLASVTDLISKLELANIQDIVYKFKDNQNRDEDDRQRYIKQYGLDYENKIFYDFVVDTSNATAEVNLKKVTDYIDSLKYDELRPKKKSSI